MSLEVGVKRAREPEEDLDPLKVSTESLEQDNELDLEYLESIAADWDDYASPPTESEHPNILKTEEINRLELENVPIHRGLMKIDDKLSALKDTMDEIDKNRILSFLRLLTASQQYEILQIYLSMSDDQREVVACALGKINMFITGGAGTGKSYLQRGLKRILSIRDGDETKTVIVAPTGIAAHNVNGVTFSSFFCQGVSDPNIDKQVALIKSNIKRAEQIRDMNVCIKDEVSMLKRDDIDVANEVCKVIRHDMKNQFGGIQILLFGDFLQLRPVNIEKKQNKDLLAFFSNSWKYLKLNYAELQVSHRQSDPKFYKMLSEMRFGWARMSKESKALLRTRYRRVLTSEDTTINNGKHLRLFARRKNVLEYNKDMLNKLHGKTHVYDSVDTGMGFEWCAAPTQLELKPGLQVLLITNLDVSNGLANGTRGTVYGFSDGFPVVDFYVNGATVRRVVGQHVFKQPGNESVTRMQIPLDIGEAFTIHKSQGMSLDYVIVSFEGIFEPGQFYVGCSRCKTLEGLLITGPWNPQELIYADKDCVNFYDKLLEAKMNAQRENQESKKTNVEK